MNAVEHYRYHYGNSKTTKKKIVYNYCGEMKTKLFISTDIEKKLICCKLMSIINFHLFKLKRKSK